MLGTKEGWQMFKRQKKYCISVTPAEYRLMVQSMVFLRNKLIAEGRYTDCVDELLMKLLA